MKIKRIAAILAVIVFLLCGCGAKATGAAEFPLPTADGAKEITVEVSNGTNFYTDAAKKFEKDTGIKVNIIDHMDGSGTMDYAKNIAEMTAGKGSDIYCYYDMDYWRFTKKNLICNLAEWMKADKYFTDDKFFTHVLKGAEENGKIYAIPLFFSIQKLSANLALPEMEKLGACNWEQFFNTAKDIRRSGRLMNMYVWEIFQQRLAARYGEIIDEKNRTEKLDSPEVIALLKQCEGWAENGLCLKPYEDVSDAEAKQMLLYRDGITIGLTDRVCKIDGMPQDETVLYDMPSDYTQDRLEHDVQPGDMAVVNAASKKKATAWKFIKFLLDDYTQLSDDAFGMPVNKSAMETRLQVDFGQLQSQDGMQFDMPEMVKKAMAYYDGIKRFYTYPEAVTIASNQSYPFFLGKSSAEQAAKQMALKVDLYLKEKA